QSSASSLSSGEYLPGSLQGKISSDGCLKKEQMVVSAIASTPHQLLREGIRVARCTVARLMAVMGLAGVLRGKKVRTTVSRKTVAAGDRVNRQ
ncbi:IS3 family transposase, partial [Escherichia coli]|uniref:IS3 family transposase n=1 Tax=Escherichia coli TaxID=562 RepID=UPI003EDFA058